MIFEFGEAAVTACSYLRWQRSGYAHPPPGARSVSGPFIATRRGDGRIEVAIPGGERFWAHVVRLHRAAAMVLVDEQDRVLMMCGGAGSLQDRSLGAACGPDQRGARCWNRLPSVSWELRSHTGAGPS